MLSIKTKQTPRFFLLALALPLAGPVSPALAEDTATMTRNVLLEKPLTLPGEHLNTKVIRVQFPAGFKTPLHTHEGQGPRYVVKGQLKVVEAGKTGTYSAGEVFWESGHLMSVENIGASPAEIIIFELAPAK